MIEIAYLLKKILTSKLFVLVGCYVVLLFHPVEERQGEDEDGGMVARLLMFGSLVGAKHQSSR